MTPTPLLVSTGRALLGAQAAAAQWYRAGGAPAPVAAYQAKGAASYAASKVNLANPGTYDAADGAAFPTWTALTGWTFNGITQYLTIGGYVPVNQSSMLIQFSGLVIGGINAALMGGIIAAAPNTGMVCAATTGTNTRRYRNGDVVVLGAAIAASGNMAIAGDAGYWNGASEVVGLGGNGGGTTLYIGALNQGGAASAFSAVTIGACVIYAVTLTAPQVAAVAAAMALL